MAAETTMQNCAINQRLQLRLRRPSDAASIAEMLLRNSKSSYEAFGSAETIKVSVAEACFLGSTSPWEEDEMAMKSLCHALQTCMPHVQQLHIQILRDDGNHAFGSMAAACFPVYALKIMLDAIPKLKTLKLRQLKLTTQQGGYEDVDVIGRALQGHPSLCHFGWNDCIFLPSRRPPAAAPAAAGSSSSSSLACWDDFGLDPLMTSLSTIPTLESVVIHSPRRMAISASVLQRLAQQCPNLRDLELRGLDVSSPLLVDPQQLQSSPLHWMRNLERLALDLYWTESRLVQAEAAEDRARVNKALASFHATLPKLQRLILNVNFQQTDPLNHNNNDVDDDGDENNDIGAYPTSNCQRKERKQRKVRVLQNLQDAVAASIRYHTCLELLNIQVHDHPLSRRQDGPLPVLSSATFREALESNSSLTSLRLPMNGEMYDDGIDFLLRVNQSGIRHLFLDDGDQHRRHANFQRIWPSQQKTATGGDPHKELWQALNMEDWSYTELMNFSMVYFCLRENPSVICG